jgi:hypothetical protein
MPTVASSLGSLSRLAVRNQVAFLTVAGGRSP